MEPIPISPQGTITLPPSYRKRLGLDKLPYPMLLVEECDGSLFLQPSAVVPLRELSEETLAAWIADDEAELVELGLDDLVGR